MVDKPYPLVLTPGFHEDLFLAVEYVDKVLKAPIAARNLFDGIIEQLERVRVSPTAAIVRKDTHGKTFYMVSYTNWNIYYVFEQDTIKVVGLKHQLQR